MTKDEIQFHFANPVMPVQNAKAAAQYYRDTLGFQIDVLWQNPHYACVSRGGISIEFGEGRPSHVGSGVCVIQVSDADQLHEEFKSRGVNFIGNFDARDYGSKDFRVRDLDGNLLIFGSPLANKNELIARQNLVATPLI